MREWIANHLGRVHPYHQRLSRRAQFGTGQHVLHTRHGQGRFGADGLDACRGMRAGDQRDMLHARQGDVGDEAPASRNKARIFLGAALRADVAKALAGNGIHFAASEP